MNVIDSIGIGSTEGLITLPYGICEDCFNPAEGKAHVTMTGNFVLEAGVIIVVKFTDTGHGVKYLNVNSSGDKIIKYRGADNTTNALAGIFSANSIYMFMYDGAYWEYISDRDTFGGNSSDEKVKLIRISDAENDRPTTSQHHYVPISTIKRDPNDSDAPVENLQIHNKLYITQDTLNDISLHSSTFEGNQFIATSDARLKENFEEYHSSKSILDLPVYKFDFINGPKNQLGCKAQDLQEICPEIVHENDNGYLAIQESKLVYLLLQELTELKSEVMHLKNELQDRQVL